MPTVDMVFAIDVTVESETPFVKIFAGLFSLAVNCSCRGSDAQRTQKMHVTKDALTGQSRMKNHKHWVQCAIPLIGISGVDWITPWLAELDNIGLPGKEFTTLGLAKRGAE